MTDLPPRESLRVLVATPLGGNGRGGIDRLNDAVFDAIAERPHLQLSPQRLVTRGQGPLWTGPFVFIGAIARFFGLAIAARIDLVHIHLSIRGSSYRKVILGALARLFRLPYVVHLHGSDFGQFWASAPRPLGLALDHLFRRADRIILLGRVWTEVVTARVPVVRDRIVELPNAVVASSAPAIPPSDGCVRITFLGQVGPRKGTPTLIDALAQLRDRADWRAAIAGDGEVEVARASIERFGLGDRVEAPGWIGVEERDRLLQETDILVLPSTAENLPMTIVEAFARGIAVVTTPVGAIPEMVTHERNGLLTPVGDAPALAGALAQLIGDPALRDALGAEARKDFEARYDLANYVTTLADVWRAAAGRAPARALQSAR